MARDTDRAVQMQPLSGGGMMIEDIVGCLIAVAFAWAVAFQIGGEG
jgi:hypothetical protein